MSSASNPSSPTASSSEDVSKLREALNDLDHKLIQLLGERRRLSGQTAEAKQGGNLPIRDMRREEELLLERIRLAREHGLDAHYVTRLFHEIIDDSIRLQQEFVQRKANGEDRAARLVRVAFHGSEGSFSYLAGKQYFARNSDAPMFVGCGSFADVVRAVESGQVEYGLLPIENTSSGGINEVYDLLRSSQLSLIGEEKLQIEYCLVGLENVGLSNLTRVYCHPQAMAECRTFLTELRGAHIEYAADSALAAKRIREQGERLHAAIASEEAARAFGLTVLARGISNHKEHFTRYLIAARSPRKVDMRIGCKTSLVMATSHQPGSLAEALLVFRDNAINLTKLESRPVAENPGEELFYLDFDGNIEDGRIQRALTELTKCTRFIRVLGCYPSYDIPRTSVSPIATQGVPSAASSTGAAAAAPAAPKAESGGSDKKGYKLASRAHKPSDTVIEVKGVKIGGNNFVVMAGPCSVESYDQIMSCAREAKEHGAVVLRGGCFKPRSSPYSFQGLGFQGLDFMVEAGKTYGLPIITEVMAEEDLEGVAAKADILQIGARNMQNYSLLKAIGKTNRPVMLKRGLSAPIDELLQATEYILAGGNQQVMLCERGIRTFETATRNTLDLSAVPVLKKRTHLPIIVDPSHAAGERDLVPPLALAAKAVGAHGIIVEFHPEPEKALSDGPQALRYPQFEEMMATLLRS